MRPSSLKSTTQQLPGAFWGYLALVAFAIVLSILPGQARIWLTWEGFVIELVLLFFLAARSRLCRWLLMLLAISNALSLTTFILDTPTVRDIALATIFLAQATVLALPSIRLYTEPPLNPRF